MQIGLALWMEWHLDEDTVIEDGPIEPICIGQDIKWYMHSKQGVFLLSYQNKSSIGDNGSIDLEVVFEASEGDLKFKIK